MIYTCTLNPAIDYKIRLEHLDINELNRFQEGNFLVGGKGINVSIALSKLGKPSKLIGFIGGITGEQISHHVKHVLGLKSQFIRVKQMTRVNVKILIGDKETEINHDGYEIDRLDVDRLLALVSKLSPNDVLVCGGSSARGHARLYEEISEICMSNNIPFVMDTPGSLMSQYLKHKPLLVKPNIKELEDYFQQKIDANNVYSKAKALLDAGAMNVIVSLGKDGSIFMNQHVCYRAKPLTGNVTNTVGAGDSMVAGFIYAYKKQLDYKSCYTFAVAGATATTFGHELMDMNIFQEYLEKVEIEVIYENK